MGFKVFLDGKFVNSKDAKISIFDHGLLYGDGVFEGVRSYSRKVFRLEEHINRLYEGAKTIRLQIFMTKEEFQDKVLQTLKINDLDDAYVRIVVTRGAGDLGLDPRKCKTPSIFIITDKIALYPFELYEKGMPIVIAKTRRIHPLAMDPRLKSLNYLNNILGRIDAIDADVAEALMLSIDGYAVECTGDNIVIVREGRIFSPPSNIGALEGITLKAIMELAEKRGIKAEYKNILPEEITKADECFLTGTAAEVIPVVKIDDKVIGIGRPGEITKQMCLDYKRLTETEGTEY